MTLICILRQKGATARKTCRGVSGGVQANRRGDGHRQLRHRHLWKLPTSLVNKWRDERIASHLVSFPRDGWRALMHPRGMGFVGGDCRGSHAEPTCLGGQQISVYVGIENWPRPFIRLRGHFWGGWQVSTSGEDRGGGPPAQQRDRRRRSPRPPGRSQWTSSRGSGRGPGWSRAGGGNIPPTRQPKKIELINK